EMAQSFQVMDPEEAAPILENMNQNLAVQVLNDVASEERGEILGQMDPEAAANIASMLIEE
ncbi:MgtE protein, partial [Halobacillus trueperi]